MAAFRLSALVTALGRSASVTQRFWLIAIVALAPMAFACALLWREVAADLDRLRNERAGVDYARVVWRTLEATAAGKTIDAEKIAALKTAAAAYDRRFGSSSQSASLLQLIEDGAPAPDTATAALQLMARVSEGSALYLDDHRITYHQMLLLVGHLPEVAAAIADANANLDSAPGPGSVAAGLSLAQLKFSVQRAERGVIDMLEATQDPVARTRLTDALRALQAASERHDRTSRVWFRQRSDLLARGYPEKAPEATDALRAGHARLLEGAAAVWREAALGLSAGLLEREARTFNIAAAVLLSIVLAIGLIAGLIWFLSRSVLAPWQELMQAVTRVRAGDPDAIVPCQDYTNEIGDAARALELFRRAIAERDSLAADLARERDALETRVAARTNELESARAAALESEELLQQALRSVRAGAWSINHATRGLWSSRQVTEICGKPFQVGDFQDGIWNLVPEPQASELRALPKDPATGLRGVGYDLPIKRPDGLERWVHTTAVTLPDGRVVGLLMDVTARKTQELELAEARRRAEEANAAKSRFIAAMSHEIRTPLNGVLAMAAALKRTPLDADQARMLNVMNNCGLTLMGMLDDVLDMAKIEAGGLALHEEPFDLAARLDEVAALFRPSAQNKGLTLTAEIDESLRGVWRGDQLRIRQILHNLIANAVKFTNAGGVTVRARNVDGRVRVEVEDTGIGIESDRLASLFQPFSQADNSITREFGGTGLGLAICRELATLMGGSVTVRSEPGAGSVFTFEVPLDRVDGFASPPPAQTRILAAEDNHGNRIVLETILRQAGLEADFVTNGADAIEAARVAAYDLILMDLHMPQIDGIAAARAIRGGRGPNAGTPIVALTASVGARTMAACRAAGMTGHVPKPIEPAVLYAAIAEALEAPIAPLASSAAAS